MSNISRLETHNNEGSDENQILSGFLERKLFVFIIQNQTDSVAPLFGFTDSCCSV